MKLRQLEISQYKNLRNFTITFSHDTITVLLGQNGSGKSNVLEALVVIFCDLDLGKPPEFSYALHYECRGNEVHIDADPARGRLEDQVRIAIRNPGEPPTQIPYQRFYSDPQRYYLPSYVCGYYSGTSNRIEKHFDEHRERFYHNLLAGKDQPLLPLLYACPMHNQFALLALFAEEKRPLEENGQSIRAFLEDVLGLQELDSALFVMREPLWISEEGDARSLNVRGEVGRFLAHVNDLAQAPKRPHERIPSELSNQESPEHLRQYLLRIDDLRNLYANYGNQQELFKALVSAYVAKVLSEVRLRLRRRGADDVLASRDLSEGEQQLLTVLGLLRFTKDDEGLFLLDGPDTHLHPAWSVQYLDFMRGMMRNQPTSQVVLATHNPLVIAGMECDNVRILQRSGQGTISVEEPRESPRGMGVAAILTSEMFGLRSALDLPTQELLDRQRVLAAQKELSKSEREELGKLTSHLDALGFMMAEDDPLYAEFLKRFTRREDSTLRETVVLTPEQQAEQERMINEIIDELTREGKW